VLELDEEKLEIYNDITTLVNGIEDLSVENTDLKNSLNKLRKDLNNRPAVTSSVIAIKEKIDE
jgi:regulator of replication initiation timing